MTLRKHHIAADSHAGIWVALCGAMARGHTRMHNALTHLTQEQRDSMCLSCLKKLNTRHSWALYDALTHHRGEDV